MKVLFCGPLDSPVYGYLVRIENDVQRVEGWIGTPDADLIVSHGYREIIPPDVLAKTPAVNLHIGYLPWNRGAHPNFWSIYEGTPGGVTIHWMDENIDTGPIIVQRRIDPEIFISLRASYERLQREIVELFIEWWPQIRLGGTPGRSQDDPAGYRSGSEHRMVDLPAGVDWNDLGAEWWGTGIKGAKRLCR